MKSYIKILLLCIFSCAVQCAEKNPLSGSSDKIPIPARKKQKDFIVLDRSPTPWSPSSASKPLTPGIYFSAIFNQSCSPSPDVYGKQPK